jgi:hypothetical protein
VAGDPIDDGDAVRHIGTDDDQVGRCDLLAETPRNVTQGVVKFERPAARLVEIAVVPISGNVSFKEFDVRAVPKR